MSVNVGTAVGYLDLDFSKFSNGFKNAAKELQGFTDKSNSLGDRVTNLGGTLKNVGSSMTKNFTLPLVGIGAVSVKTAADFEAGMSKVQAISGATGNDMQKLEKMAKDLGASTKFSATEAAEALSFMGMAGWDTQSMLDGLPGVLDLAAAGGTDLATTSDIVTDGLTSLGLTAKDTGMFVDVMAATCNSSNTSIELMGDTLKYVGPVAGALGIDMQSLSSAIGLMGNAGIKGSQAGTALRAGLNRLIKPTDESAAAMKKYGIEIQKNSDGSVDLMSTMHLLRGKLGDLDETTQAAALSTIFGTEAMSGWAAIVNASESDFEKLNESIYNADGAAKQVAETMQDNLSGQLTNLKSALEGAAISIGEALLPVIKKLVEWIQKAVDWFNNLSPAMKTTIVVIGGIVAAIGPVLMIMGQLLITIGGLIIGFTAIGGMAGIVAGAIALITSPVTLVIAGITALIAAGALLIANWDEIKAKCSEVWEGVKNAIDDAFTWICDLIGVDSELIKTTLFEAWDSIKTNVTEAWENIKTTISEAWDSIFGTITETANNIKTAINEAWTFIKDQVIGVIGDAITALINGDWEECKRLVKEAVENIKNKVKETWDKIKEELSQCMDRIKESIKQGWEKIKNDTKTKVDNIKQDVKAAWDKIKGDAEKGWQNIKNAIKTMVGGIKDDISRKLQDAWNTCNEWWAKIKNIFKNPIKGVIEIFKKEKSSIMPNPNTEASTFATRDNDYSKARFDYSNARQVYASNNLSLEGIIRDGLSDLIKIDTGKAKQSSNTNNNMSVSLNIDKFINESKQDVNELMDEIAFQLKRKSFI